MKTYISVIIPAHNEEEYISRCLDALLKQDYGREFYEIIVVDNASDDRTPEIVKKYKDVKYLYKKEGPVGAVRNYGVTFASGTYLAFIDADCVAPRDWLSSGALLLSEAQDYAFGGKCTADANSLWIEEYWLLGSKKEVYESTDLLGACTFIRKSDFEKVGGFSEVISSGEDTKLASDLNKIQVKTFIDQKINVIHLGNAKDAKSFIKRQIWHSENYVKNIESSIFDPTFLLTITFIILSIISILILIRSGITMELLILILASASCPAILSTKRILRSEIRPSDPKQIMKIYAIDILYITGRSAGIIKSLTNGRPKLFSNDKNIKIG